MKMDKNGLELMEMAKMVKLAKIVKTVKLVKNGQKWLEMIRIG